MIFSRLGRAFAPRPSRPASTPEGTRVYVIGDVHGRDDLLGELAGLIERDCASAPAEALTLLLGDYVDRGPHSAAVVERLAAGRLPTRFRALRGNHEALLLQFLADPMVLEFWRRYGGLATLHSYGVDVAKAMRGEGYEATRDALLAALPAAHRRFLEATELSVTLGDYFFCHAGVRPGTPLARQSAEDLLWIRDGFLACERPFGKIVVHGHTPCEQVEEMPNRINIDTGAYATGCLSCFVAEPKGHRFLATA